MAGGALEAPTRADGEAGGADADGDCGRLGGAREADPGARERRLEARSAALTEVVVHGGEDGQGEHGAVDEHAAGGAVEGEEEGVREVAEVDDGAGDEELAGGDPDEYPALAVEERGDPAGRQGREISPGQVAPVGAEGGGSCRGVEERGGRRQEGAHPSVVAERRE